MEVLKLLKREIAGTGENRTERDRQELAEDNYFRK